LINLRALRRLVEATDDSAMQFFISAFSASRLKAFDFFLPPFLSFLGFNVELKKEPTGGVELLLV
jgi:hypothetical protein